MVSFPFFHHNCITNPSKPATILWSGKFEISTQKRITKQTMSTTYCLILELPPTKKNNEPAKGNQIFHPLKHPHQPGILPLPTEVPYTIRGRAEVMAMFQEVLMAATSLEIHCPNVWFMDPKYLLASGHLSSVSGKDSCLVSRSYVKEFILKNCKPNKFRRVFVVG